MDEDNDHRDDHTHAEDEKRGTREGSDPAPVMNEVGDPGSEPDLLA
jgi:hypothetical protein